MHSAMILLVAVALAVPVSGQLARHGTATGGRLDETTRLINDCERRTNGFKRTLDHALARSNVRAGQGREDQLNNNAKRLEQQFNIVGDSWNRDHNMNKTRNHVQAALALGRDIDKAMRTWNMGGDAESEWAALRAEMNRLAQHFGLSKIR